MKRMLMLLILGGIVGYASVGFAIPQQINYQGYLTRTDGTPLDTTVAMTFTIYDALAGGNAVWTETRPAVAVAGGLFNASLGSVTPLPDVFPANRYLGVRVGNNTEMNPRTPMTSVAHAYRVGTVDGASGGTITGNVTIVGKGNIGYSNSNSGQYSFVAGGADTARGYGSTVTGGMFSIADGDYTTVSGGYMSVAGGEGSVVGGGEMNFTEGLAATVGGGLNNGVIGDHSGVFSGRNNAAFSFAGYVGGGWYNSAGGDSSAVGGGAHNSAGGIAATVAGGSGNSASAAQATISGGVQNNASGLMATVGGGYRNTASGFAATVPGGESNRAGGFYSFAAGDSALANGSHSFALGTRILCNADSAFVWSDGTGNYTGVGASRTFSVKASGGVRIWTSSDISSGVRIDAGGNAWVAVSDSTKKRNIRGLDTRDILNRFSSLPLKRWEYKSEEPGVEHVGPMAQDFWNAFHLGNEPLGISTIDADGVVMATVQQLCREVEELRAEIRNLKANKEATSNTGR